MSDPQKKPNLRLRLERKNRGWSQARLAELIGADNSMVSRWETGERNPEPFYQEKLCTLFNKSATELGFLDGFSSSLRSSSKLDLTPFSICIPMFQQEQTIVHNAKDACLPLSQRDSTIASSNDLLKSIIERKFSKGITYDLLTSNIKTLNFRDEWQYIVNNLVSETKVSLRAMVFDVELTRWWNTIAGQIYMITNMELLKRKVPVKRIFLISSLNMQLRTNMLINAYVHHKIGIDVKVCKVAGFQNNIPFKPDMFSVHDDMFVALYYLSPEKPLTNLLLEDKYSADFSSFYDELFADDRLCINIESVLANSNFGKGFFASIQTQLELIQRLEKVSSTIELIRSF